MLVLSIRCEALGIWSCRADILQCGSVIRIRVLARAHNMLPGILADIAEDVGHTLDATRGRWDATSERSRAVLLERIIELPAVPREGEEVWIGPYSEAMTVTSVTWRVDPSTEDDGQPVHVDMWVDELDLDVLADTETALAWFRDAGWDIETDDG
jgi:hypothetical protein